MAINTTYNPNYAQSYISQLYTGAGSTATTTGTGANATKSTAATQLRNEAGVEVTLSAAALQALAQQTAKTETDDKADVITARIKSLLATLVLDNAKQAEAADKALPADATAARKKAAQQATDFLHGKAANPFKNQSPQDLAAIIVDTTNAYTLNERRAAFAEFARQDNAKLLDELTPKTEFDRKVNDAEVPKSGDTDRLASAKQATEFLSGKKDVKNPFAGKSRDELTAIVANDSGDYTVNERRVALAERERLEKIVRDGLSVQLSAEARRDADRETPVSVNAERLAQALQATRFAYKLDKNPFAGLTRDELNAIVYDETKSYTVHERRAAFAELKQYLPSDGTTSSSSSNSSSTTKTDTSTDTAKDKDDPYKSSGAYNMFQMRQVLRAQNTSLLLSVLSSTSSQNKSGLAALFG
jgi:hypothetical protein